GAHDGHELAGRDLHAYAAQGVHLVFAQVVVLVHVLHADDGPCERCAFGMRQFNLANFALGSGCHQCILVIPLPSPPDFWVVLTAPVTRSSPGCRLPLSSWATAVLVWSVI